MASEFSTGLNEFFQTEKSFIVLLKKISQETLFFTEKSDKSAFFSAEIFFFCL
jgi:hypothetical protein